MGRMDGKVAFVTDADAVLFLAPARPAAPPGIALPVVVNSYLK